MTKQAKVKEELKEEMKVRSFLKNISQILFFPEWRNLVIYPGKGEYHNQIVDEIIKDNVALLPDLIITDFDNVTGEPFVFLTGVGVYYVQFKLSGNIVTDFREITGIYLPLSIYERAKEATGLVDSPQLLMTEYMFSIPFALFTQEQTTQMYLRGVISRNIIHPYKDCFNQILNICKNPNSLIKENGYKILNAKTNSILTEKVLDSYSTETAGLDSIQPDVSSIINQLQLETDEMKIKLFDKLQVIKKDFINYGYPKLIDWVPK